MAYAAWDLTVFGLKHGPPSLMGPQSIPLLLQTKSMFACNAASLASLLGTHHFFFEEDEEKGDSDGVNAVGLDVGPGACINCKLLQYAFTLTINISSIPFVHYFTSLRRQN